MRVRHLDPWSRIALRWACLLTIAAFVALVAAAVVGGPLHLIAPGWARTAAVGLIGVTGVWIVGRPIALAGARPAGAVGATGGVSVVIPCCNTSAAIEDTVASILAQTFRPIEILLVENNSTDDTWEVVRRLDERHPEVRGLRVEVTADEYAASVAINHGVAHASHEAVVRMDDDTIMAPTMIEECAAVLMTEGTSAVAVNLRVANPTESIVTRLQSIEYMLAMELDRRFQALFGSVVCCSGGLSGYRRSVLIAAKGFCSAPKWVSEDLDMTMKSHRFGNVRMAPAAIGYTRVPGTLRALLRQRYRWGITGVVAFYLHRRGIGRRGYWYDGRIGFLGLPMLGIIKLRDMLAFTYVGFLALALAAGGWKWLVILGLARAASMALQLLLMRAVVETDQGVSSYWLIPVFLIAYGPLTLAARCAGAWSGLRDVHRLRRRQDRLEHAGLDPEAGLSRGLEIAAAPDPLEAAPRATAPPHKPDGPPAPPRAAVATAAPGPNWQRWALAAAGGVVVVVAMRRRLGGAAA